MTAALLAVLAVALAWPIPDALARARWPWVCPRAAIVLWQAIGLAGGVALLGACLALGTGPLAHSVSGGLLTLGRNAAAGDPQRRLAEANVAGLALATLLAARLLGVLGSSSAQVLRARARQRHLVDLVALGHAHPVPCERRPRGLRVLDHPVAVAYCVPGVRPRVVVSDGALATLATGELDAVLAHEEAHARGRHDLVVQPFVAWESTFPFLAPARQATAAVSLLVEMLADDAAARRTGGRVLAGALVRLGIARTPQGSLAASGGPTGAVVARVGRLLDPAPAPWWLPAVAYLGAALVLSLPVALLLLA